MPAARPISERFWEKVIRRGEDECWSWTAYRTPFGHGLIKNGRRMDVASRVSYRLNVGPIPEGLFVLHKCDNPECTNPNHLFLGTQAENVADMMAKGRNFFPGYPPKKVCKHGHKMSGANVIYYKRPDGSIERICKTCNVEHKKQWYQRNKRRTAA